MPVYVAETVIWTFVAAFVACIIGGVLMIFGFWEPKDPAVKKWLFSGVLISVVGAVVGFGVQQFQPPKNEADNRHPVAVSDTHAEPRRPAEPPVRDRVRDDETNSEAESDRTPDNPVPDPATPAISDDLKAWAAAELGPRPMLNPDAPKNYPSCVARLKAKDAEDLTSEDARVCRRELQDFHVDQIVSFYDTKRPYDRKLEAVEVALRKGGLHGDEVPKFNYVAAEMDRLNGEDSSEASEFHSLEQRLLADIESCRRSLCR